MARNKYPGICYRCDRPVAVGAGHFERHKGKWRTQHAECAIAARQSEGPSIASQMLEAEMNRAMGLRVDDSIGDMLP